MRWRRVWRWRRCSPTGSRPRRASSTRPPAPAPSCARSRAGRARPGHRHRHAAGRRRGGRARSRSPSRTRWRRPRRARWPSCSSTSPTPATPARSCAPPRPPVPRRYSSAGARWIRATRSAFGHPRGRCSTCPSRREVTWERCWSGWASSASAGRPRSCTAARPTTRPTSPVRSRSCSGARPTACPSRSLAAVDERLTHPDGRPLGVAQRGDGRLGAVLRVAPAAAAPRR